MKEKEVHCADEPRCRFLLSQTPGREFDLNISGKQEQNSVSLSDIHSELPAAPSSGELPSPFDGRDFVAFAKRDKKNFFPAFLIAIFSQCPNRGFKKRLLFISKNYLFVNILKKCVKMAIL